MELEKQRALEEQEEVKEQEELEQQDELEEEEELVEQEELYLVGDDTGTKDSRRFNFLRSVKR